MFPVEPVNIPILSETERLVPDFYYTFPHLAVGAPALGAVFVPQLQQRLRIEGAAYRHPHSAPTAHDGIVLRRNISQQVESGIFQRSFPGSLSVTTALIASRSAFSAPMRRGHRSPEPSGT